MNFCTFEPEFDLWPVERWTIPYLRAVSNKIINEILQHGKYVRYNHRLDWRGDDFICIDYPHSTYIKLSVVNLHGEPNLTLQHVLQGSGGHNLMEPRHVLLDDPGAADTVYIDALILFQTCKARIAPY